MTHSLTQKRIKPMKTFYKYAAFAAAALAGLCACSSDDDAAETGSGLQPVAQPHRPHHDQHPAAEQRGCPDAHPSSRGIAQPHRRPQTERTGQPQRQCRTKRNFNLLCSQSQTRSKGIHAQRQRQKRTSPQSFCQTIISLSRFCCYLMSGRKNRCKKILKNS